MAKAKESPEFDPATLDALIGDAKSPEDFVGLMRAIQKRLAERMLAGELTAHLGYALTELESATSGSSSRSGNPSQRVFRGMAGPAAGYTFRRSSDISG